MSTPQSMSLEEFLEKPEVVRQKILQKAESKKTLNAVFQEVVTALHSFIKPVEIVKGGSQGKGTSLWNRNEVDVVVILHEFEPNKSFVTELLAEWELHLRKTFQSNNNNNDEKIHKRLYSLNMVHKNVEFDILPGKVLTPQEFLKYNTQERGFLSASASRFQADFIKHQPPQYKDLVRYCKYWKSLKEFTKSTKPSSYLIELICLKAFENTTNHNSKFKLRSGFREFLKLVQDPNLKVASFHFYHGSELWHTESALVLDPGNPTNDIGSALQDWNPFRQYAKETLDLLKSNHKLKELVLTDIEAEIQSLEESKKLKLKQKEEFVFLCEHHKPPTRMISVKSYEKHLKKCKGKTSNVNTTPGKAAPSSALTSTTTPKLESKVATTQLVTLFPLPSSSNTNCNIGPKMKKCEKCNSKILSSNIKHQNIPHCQFCKTSFRKQKGLDAHIQAIHKHKTQLM